MSGDAGCPRLCMKLNNAIARKEARPANRFLGSDICLLSRADRLQAVGLVHGVKLLQDLRSQGHHP